MQISDLMRDYFSNNREEKLSVVEEQQPRSSWEVVDSPERLIKDYQFSDRQRALEFTRQLFLYEDSVNHHGKVTIEHKQVRVEVYTHDIQTVTELDSEYAVAADQIYFDVEF